MEKTKTYPWDAADYLESKEDIAAYIEAALEDGDPELLKAVLDDIARSKVIAQERIPMREEYDFSGGVRGKHYKAYREGTNLILLEPGLAKIFKDSAAVNAALRKLTELAPEYVSQI